MARSHGSVRMGPISLFTLVITLCLAVMALLAFTTGRAELALTQRQQTATTDLYANEAAAQQFVAALDSRLAQLRQGGDPRQEEALGAAVDAAVVAATGAADVAGIQQAFGPGATADTADASPIPTDLPTPITITATLIDPAEAVSLAGTLNAPSLDLTDATRGVHAQFTAESGRNLDAVLLLYGDGTYEILAWKATTLWDEHGSGDTLWAG